MDAALKARKLGSASVRRKRMQERQLEQHIAYEERVNRKKQIMAEIHSLESSEDESDHSTSSGPDLDFTADTPVEPLLQTPQDLSSSDLFISLTPTSYGRQTESIDLGKKSKELGTITSRSQVTPKMQATLTTVADWNYDRFSMLVDPAEVEDLFDQTENEEESEFSSSDEDVEEYSPIKIATPVTYTMPTTRPAVVSISNIYNQVAAVKPLKIDTSMKKRPTIRRHVSEQLLLGSPRDIFKAHEAKSFHTANSSRDTLESMMDSMMDSNHGSRSVSLASQTDFTISRSVSQTSQSDQSINRSPKRKSSMPLLFGGNKNGHSRMSSIKKFMRSSTLGPPTATTSSAFGHTQRQPSSSTLETHFETRGASIELSRTLTVEQPIRPKTAVAHSPPPPTMEDLTALPSTRRVPTLAEETPNPQPSSPAIRNEAANTKSKSRFRQRSGSIGQALKSISSGPKKADASAPPLPAIMIPSLSSSKFLDEQALSTPPPLTPKSPRRSMAGYSAFPVHEKRTSSLNVGLGLRM